MPFDWLPKVSLIWLNYNSSPIIDVILDSLNSLLNLNYPNYEIILVDNASNDGSIDILKAFLRTVKLQREHLPPIKFIENDRNLGYTGGNYIGYKYRSKDSKYIVSVNNDFEIEPESLMSFVRYLEEHNDVGAVQGKITIWNGSRIGNCGFYFDSMYRGYLRYNGLPITKGIREAMVSFVPGCYSVFRVKAIEKVGGLFGKCRAFFAYFEDADVCLRLWRNGFKVKYLPILAGRHKGGASFSRDQPLINYLKNRNRLCFIFNLTGVRRFMVVPWVVYILSRILIYLGLSILDGNDYKMRAKYITRALTDSFLLARKMQKIEGDALEPQIKLRISTFIKMVFLPSYTASIISSLVNHKGTYRIKV